MSLGYVGSCNLIYEDDKRVIYSYAGENWNDTNSKVGDIDLQDGEFTIYKRCLEEPEIHEKIVKLPSHRKKKIVKRIIHVPHINNYK